MVYLKNKILEGGGCYGEYYKISRSVGVKLVNSSDFYNFESLPYRLLSKDLTIVFLEAIYLNLFYGSNFAKVEICDLNSKLFLGIKKKHLVGKAFSIHNKYIKNNKIVFKKTSMPLGLKVSNELSRKKIFNHDVGEGNVLFNKGKIYPIDFSPAMTQYFGNKRLFTKELNVVLKEFEKQYWFVKLYKKTIKNIILKQAKF